MYTINIEQLFINYVKEKIQILIITNVIALVSSFCI